MALIAGSQSPLHSQILAAINSIRPYLYGPEFKIQILKFNGTDVQYDFLAELDLDYIISFDRSGNLTLMYSSDVFATELRSATHLVFEGWLYQLTEPAYPEQGPFPMWKATGRPLGSKYIPEVVILVNARNDNGSTSGDFNSIGETPDSNRGTE